MKFTIRELLLVTVIVAMGTGWWVDRTRLLAEAENRRIIEIQLRDELQKEKLHLHTFDGHWHPRSDWRGEGDRFPP